VPRWRCASVALLASFVVANSTFADEVGDELYRSGHYERALESWRQAATAGDVRAAYRLGVALADGVVVKQDYREARTWYRMAADAGDAEAQFDLGSLYDNGFEVEKSASEAAKWYLKAARQGHVACQYNLATMYERGIGVEQDLVQAYMWYHLAAQQGFSGTRDGNLGILSKKLSEADIERAIEMADDFEPGE